MRKVISFFRNVALSPGRSILYMRGRVARSLVHRSGLREQLSDIRNELQGLRQQISQLPAPVAKLTEAASASSSSNTPAKNATNTPYVLIDNGRLALAMIGGVSIMFSPANYTDWRLFESAPLFPRFDSIVKILAGVPFRRVSFWSYEDPVLPNFAARSPLATAKISVISCSEIQSLFLGRLFSTVNPAQEIVAYNNTDEFFSEIDISLEQNTDLSPAYNLVICAYKGLNELQQSILSLGRLLYHGSTFFVFVPDRDRMLSDTTPADDRPDEFKKFLWRQSLNAYFVEGDNLINICSDPIRSDVGNQTLVFAPFYFETNWNCIVA